MASKSANISVRVEPEIKEQAEKILERVGVSVSALINMTYRQVILRNGIPFSVTIPTELESLDTMSDEEFDEMMQTGLMQAKAGETIPCEAAFDQLMQGL